MINPKKYNSRYSALTEEERRAKYRENTKNWKKAQGKKKQYEYLHKKCDICNHLYANIYEHLKSKKHTINLEKSTIVNNTKLVETLDSPLPKV